jgi:hypothetical protein
MRKDFYLIKEREFKVKRIKNEEIKNDPYGEQVEINFSEGEQNGLS